MSASHRPSAPPIPDSSYGSERASPYQGYVPPPSSTSQSSSYGQPPIASSPYGYGQQNPQYGYSQNPYGSNQPSAYQHHEQGAPPLSAPQSLSYGQPHLPSSPPYSQEQQNLQYGYGQDPYRYEQNSYYGQPPQQSSFPPGTDPEVIRMFQTVDRDRSGFIDERELQQALSSGYQRFSMRTIRLLLFVLRKDHDSADKIGPAGFAALWKCLGEWRGIFERFDRYQSGKIDSTELKEAFFSIGYAVPPSVLQLLITSYDDHRSGRKVELNFDSFVECAMIIKGLTEKFKEKDTQYSGSATFTYDSFLSMVLPFLVRYD